MSLPQGAQPVGPSPAVRPRSLGAEPTARRSRRRDPVRFLFLAPALGLLALVTLLPMAYALGISFFRYLITQPYRRPFVFLQNYLAVLTDETTAHSLRVTLAFGFWSVAWELVIGFALALLLRQISRGRLVFLGILMLPMMLPPVAVALMWRILLHPDLGIVNYLLSQAGLPALPWLASPETALATVIFVDVWQWTPFMFLLLYAGLLSLPSEPFEAARVDGATLLQQFGYLTLPLMAPVLLVAVVVRLIDALKTYALIYILTDGGPGISTETVTYHIYRLGFVSSDMGRASALSYLLSLVIVGLTIILVFRGRRAAFVTA